MITIVRRAWLRVLEHRFSARCAVDVRSVFRELQGRVCIASGCLWSRACPRPADRPSPAAGCRVTAPRGRAQVLDHYLSAQGQPAFNLTHGLDISAQFIGNAARNQGQTKM